MWYVYVLENLSLRKYIGYTNDLRQRLKQHNSRSFTNTYTYKNGPWKLIYYEAYSNKYDAVDAERFNKTGNGREILKGKLKNYLTGNQI